MRYLCNLCAWFSFSEKVWLMFGNYIVIGCGYWWGQWLCPFLRATLVELTWPPPTTEDHLLSSLSTGHTSEPPFLWNHFLLFCCFGAESCSVSFFWLKQLVCKMHTDFFHPDTNLYSCVCNTSDGKKKYSLLTLCFSGCFGFGKTDAFHVVGKYKFMLRSSFITAGLQHKLINTFYSTKW